MTEFILLYLFFASCMAAAAYSITNEANWIGLLFVSLFWPWFLFVSLFSMLIK
jgi:predicted acyltransferase